MNVQKLNNGERQVAPTVDGIRADHVARYRWAAQVLPPNSKVLDLACGVGYGSFILAEAGHVVLGVDRSPEAIRYARNFYLKPDYTDFLCSDLEAFVSPFTHVDAIICFETLEHLKNPGELLKRWTNWAPLLLASVPNEEAFPHNGQVLHHYRHYTPVEFEELLDESGWDGVRGLYHQPTALSEKVEPYPVIGAPGRTLVTIVAKASAEVLPDILAPKIEVPDEPVNIFVGDEGPELSLHSWEAEPGADFSEPVTGFEDHELDWKDTPPEHVAIVGLGPSDAAWVDMVKRCGGRHAYCDRVWTINAHGAVLDCDLIFHMDDVRIQEIRAKANPSGNIAKMLKWMKNPRVPIVTSIPHPDYPGTVAFPLEEVINTLCFNYFNNTAAYAIAYAIFIGVKRISLFGIDFTYPNSNHAEAGRACCEYWLGIAMQKGIQVTVSGYSTLLDANVPADQKPYGYDSVDVHLEELPEGKARISFTEKVRLPTAEEMEDRYNHNKTPADRAFAQTRS